MKSKISRYLMGLFFSISVETFAQFEPQAPLFIDPNYYGSCDPEIVFNESDKHYYIYYTSRRSLIESNFVATPIGVVKSKDLKSWTFEGYCKFDGIGGQKDHSSTFWAPAIIAHRGELHMFVTWKPDTTTAKGPWGGAAKIVHYKTSLKNPTNGWKKVSDMHNENINSLDATVYQKDGVFHVWYKGKLKTEKQNHLFHLESTDLENWKNSGVSQSEVFNPEITKESFEEAPYIFKWHDKFWLLTDPHKGLMVYESSNGENWKYQGIILKEGGTRSMDNSMARHCSVLVKDNRAFIFYHVEPWRDYNSPIPKQPTSNRRAVLQMAELKVENGKIVCDRNQVKL